MNSRTLRKLLLSLGLLVLTPMAVFGQSADQLCEEFINVVFPQIGTNCANVESGSACYGYGDVAITFYVDGQARQSLDNVFTAEADRTAAFDGSSGTVIESLDAAEFELNSQNVLESVWGVSIQEVQANLPVLSGESVGYVVFGGGRVENAVLPENAFIPAAEPVVVSYDRVAVFSAPPDLNYFNVQSEELETLSGGGTLEADAISADGAWLRVFFPYDRRFGERLEAWVPVDQLSEVAGIENLPVFSAESYTTMQHAYLTNPLDLPSCEIVPPPGLMVQGPQRVETDVMIDDLPVRVTSTAFIREVAPGVLEVFAVNGVSISHPETGFELVIPQGYSGYFCLSELLDLGINELDDDKQVIEGCPARLIPPGQNNLEQFQGLDRFPGPRYTPNPPNIICFSGVGGPVCEIREVEEIRIGELCDAGVIRQELCDILLNR